MNTFQPAPDVDASAPQRGLITSLAQTFAGVKTFNEGLVMPSTAALEMNGVGGGVKLSFRAASDGLAGVHNGASVYLGIYPGSGLAGCSGTFRAGINAGSPVEMSNQLIKFSSTGQSIIQWDAALGNRWEIRGTPNVGFSMGNNGVAYAGMRLSDGHFFSDFGFTSPLGSIRLGMVNSPSPSIFFYTGATGTGGADANYGSFASRHTINAGTTQGLMLESSAGIVRIGGIGGIAPAGSQLQVGGNVQFNVDAATARPTANAANRGVVWYSKSAGGVADTLEVCLKSAADTYSWKVIQTG